MDCTYKFFFSNMERTFFLKRTHPIPNTCTEEIDFYSLLTRKSNIHITNWITYYIVFKKSDVKKKVSESRGCKMKIKMNS